MTTLQSCLPCSNRRWICAIVLSATLPLGAQTPNEPSLAEFSSIESAPLPSATVKSVLGIPNAGVGFLDDTRKLAPGDRLSFRVAEEGFDPVAVTVASSGEIDFPMVGRVPAAGRTCRAVAEEVRGRLETGFYKKATVGLALETASTLPMGTYFVSGQVVKPGAQDIPRDREVTVAAAILEAGGFADFADQRRVRLIRPVGEGGEPERFKVDVKAVLQSGEPHKDMVVRPGDYIVVPERFFNF